MRVNYTLPELGPASFEESSSGGETQLGFRDQLRGFSPPVSQSWEHELRLDLRPFTATYIGPPPRPTNLEPQDPATERLRWRNLLLRHTRSVEGASNQLTSTRPQAIEAMLEMLDQMLGMEDEITAQSVAVTRG